MTVRDLPLEPGSRAGGATGVLRLAAAALERFGHAGSRLELLVHTVNATLRVDAPDGERYALRLYGPGEADPAEIRSEQVWLAELAAAGLGVPEPVPATDGETVIVLPPDTGPEGSDAAAAAGERHAVLFRWVHGRFLTGDALTPAAYRKVGSFMARMHRRSEEFRPPPGFTRQAWDLTDLEDRLPDAGFELLARRDVPLLAAAARQVAAEVADLPRDPGHYGLIHSDFQSRNFLFAEDGDGEGAGTVRAIDFADCGWGYYLYDVASSLLRLADRDDFPALRDAFLAGYREVRPLPQELAARLETFMAARGLYVLEWIADHWQSPPVRDYGRGTVPYLLAQVRGFVERRLGRDALDDGSLASLTTVRFLARLRERGIELSADGEGLRFRAPRGAVTDEIKEEIRQRRPELLAFLGTAAATAAQPPLEPVPRDGELPLSFAQQRMWFFDRLEPGSPAYNIPPAVRLEGPLAVSVLARCFAEIVRRHEVLRSTFPTIQGRPRLVIGATLEVPLPVVDLGALPADRREAEGRRLTRFEARRPFDLARGPLVRLLLVRLAPRDHLVLVTFHHIVSDGWSGGVLVRELAALYPAFLEGRPSPLPELALQYVDYAAWQRRWLTGEVLEQRLAAWKERLAGMPEVLQLPTDRPTPAVQTYRGDKKVFALPADLSADLVGLGREVGATPFMVLLALFQALLARYTGQWDVPVGTPIANRTRSELEPLIGFFVNTLVLRTRLARRDGFRRLVEAVRRVTLEAYADQDVPLEKLVESLRPSRDLAHQPLFQVLFVLQNQPMPELEVAGVAFRFQVPRTGTATFDLTLSMRETADGFRGSLAYRSDLFDASTMDRLLGHFRTLAESAVAAPQVGLEDLPLLSPDERHQLVHGWNDTASPYAAGGATLVDLLLAQAARTPEAAALVMEDDAGEVRTLTYRQLHGRASRLAHHLRSLGVGPEVRVGVAAERSFELVEALVAVMLAGGAYVPLDPGYPAERLAFMARDSSLPVILTQSHVAETLPAELSRGGPRLVRLDADRGDWESLPDAAPAPALSPESLAYVIYTSGSTGRPKGAMNSHRAIVNRLLWMQEAYGLDGGDRVLQKTPFSFDVSVWEFFWPLLTGATLVVAKPEGHRDPVYLSGLIASQGVTTLHFVPPMLGTFLEQPGLVERCAPVRRVICSGEALPREMVDRFFQRMPATAEIHNLYGPTEAAVDVTWWPCERDDRRPSVPIGRPIANLRIHVLDRRGGPVPVGVAGELHIGGVGLARGYWNRPALTAEKFVADPLAADFADAGDGHYGGAGARLYRTGDLARLRPGGEVEFLGRLDHQVKVRGFRIELGEIEAALAAHPAVREAVVVAREQRLLAYVVAEGAAPVEEDLRRFLAAGLPEYMVPQHFVVLPELPLSPNGKVDRRALPEPSLERTAAAPYAAPRGELERLLAEVWSEVLGRDEVGRRDNFFDLGGHSLLVVEVLARVEARTGLQLPVLELFKHPTLESLARRLAGDGAAQEATPAPVVRRRAVGEREVAVVAVAGRFPGAADVEAFWANLRDGVESIRTFSRQEMLADGAPRELVDRPEWVPARGALDGIELFDAPFFGLSPREAEILDPQHRLFLETAWEVLERAGCDPESWPGRVGVYAGATMSSYALFNLTSNREVMRSVGMYQALLGNDKDYLASRTAYHLDLRGPAVSVQTACSTSLVAAALACEALLDGHCDLALAGGTSVASRQRSGYLYQPGHITSPDGHCRAFDADAGGTVGGSGVAVVALRRLQDALAEGDPVLAVIKGSALNNDGAQKIGYTAPSVQGQAEVIAEAHAAAGVDPRTVGYVEAHGTATPLGDPIELAALNQAFGADPERRPAPGSCALGSVKSNVGHLDAAAGATGLIKAVLAVERGEIPPSLHYRRPNPRIDFGAFRVNDRLLPWETGGGPRRAGVSSFGIGGTNAHLVLEEAPPRPPSGPSRGQQLFLLSARTPGALEAATDRLAQRLAELPEAGPRDPGRRAADVAFTLATGRRALEHRRAVVAPDLDSARRALAGRDPQRLLAGRSDGRRPVAFLFPGQGAQFPGMGRGLYAGEAVFRDAVDRCAGLFEPLLEGEDLRSLLFPGDGDGDGEAAAQRLRDTRFTQPALFTVQHALAEQLAAWGLEPEAGMLGHSVGAYAAAVAAGVMDLEAAVALVAARGRLMAALPAGAMLSVALPEAEVEEHLAAAGGGAVVAAANAPDLVVVSGPEAAVAAVERRLAAAGAEARRLHTSHAFHSPMMDPALEPFRRAVEAVELRPPRRPFVSDLTGTWITEAEATDPDYWVRHLRRPVRFADGLGELLAEPDALLLEVGPGRTLSTLVRRHGAGAGRLAVPSLGHPRDRRDALEIVLEGLGRLWCAGARLDWRAFFAGQERRKVLLPTYPFERRRYWIEARGDVLSTGGGESADPLRVSRWTAAPLPGDGGGVTGGWAVWGADGAAVETVVAALEGGGHAARPLPPGPPAEDWRDALAELEAGAGGLAGAVYLGGLEPAGAGDADADALAHLVPLARVLDEVRAAAGRSGATLAVAVSGGFQLTPDETPVALRGALLQTLEDEARRLPAVRLLGLDLPPGGDVGEVVEEALALAAEEPSGVARLVARRDGRRWLRVVERVEAPVTAAAAEDGAVLDGHDRPDLESGYAEPAAGTEAVLAALWSDLLGIRRIGAHDDFFELGGHSLLATRVTSRVRDELGVELPLEALFEDPTVARLARRVEGMAVAATGAADLAPPVEPVSRDGDLPLSFGQQRLWFLWQLNPDSPFYNVPMAMRLRGPLDLAALARTFGAVVERHESLRTRFEAVAVGSAAADRGLRARQVVEPAPRPYPLPLVDLSALPEARREGAALRVGRATAARPFALGETPLLRVVVARLGVREHLATLVIHHVASDAWSIGVLTRDVQALYEAHRRGVAPRLPELAVQYADYAHWQRSILLPEDGDRYRAQLAWWTQRLTPLPEPLELPTDRPRPAIQGFDGARLDFDLAPLAPALRRLAREHGATLYMVLMAGLATLLHRYTGQTDVTVGSPIANRTRSELEPLVGFFVNTLVIRTDLSGEPGSSAGPRFDVLLERVREAALGAQRHQDLPFEHLVEVLKPPRDLSRTPLFQVQLAVQNVPTSRMAAADLELEAVEPESTAARFDLTLFVFERGEELRGRFVYNTRLFDGATMERAAGHLGRLLAAAAADDSRRAGELPLLGEAERRQVLAIPPEPAGASPAPPLVHRAFAAAARRDPAAPALVCDDETLSYGELAGRANRLARHLASLGVGPEARVALYLPRSTEMVVALLAVLEAGGAYLPVEPGLPAERVAVLLEDADAGWIVTLDALAGDLPPSAAIPPRHRVRLDADGAVVAARSDAPLEVPVAPENAAYVLFTSGSTGRPKGVVVEHRQIANYGAAVLARLALPERLADGDGGERPVAFATVSTLAADLGNTAVFGALTSGGTLHVITGDRVADPAAMADYFRRHPVDVLKVVPSHLEALSASDEPARVLPRLRLVLGGEALRWDEVDRVRDLAPDCAVLNHYGPTEATVGATTFTAHAGGGDHPLPASRPRRIGATVPLGRAMAAQRAYVLDRAGAPAPTGVPGELYLAGAGVARGYARRPGLTADRFVPDPFAAEAGGVPGERAYRTGDLVRRLPSGDLEYLGRLDHQVKVRGFRIELGEVETVLEDAPAVAAAVVVARRYGGPRDLRLVAYVVPAAGAAATDGDGLVEGLRHHLRERLPDYMQPAVFVELSSLPLTANGKVDRRALPEPEAARPDLAAAYAEPADDMERAVAEVWREVLQVDRVGRDDNFFDLGGHSLLLVQVATELRRRLRRELPLTALFQNPTVASLGRHLAGGEGPDLAREGERVAQQAAAGRQRMRQRAARRRGAGDDLGEG